MTAIITALLISPAFAAIPITPDSLQLQALVKNSKEQLALIKQLVDQGHRDEDSLRRAALALDKLSLGLDRSIDKYQGTKVYQEAMAMAQAQLKPNHDTTFQAAVQATNREELAEQYALTQALQTAEPGFVPKLQALAQIGIWRSNTRVSMQLHEISDRLRLERRGPFDLTTLIRGSDEQNMKQREAAHNGLH